MRTELEMEKIINLSKSLDRKRKIWHLKHDRVEDVVIDKNEMSTYLLDLGKQYMEYRKPQPSYPVLSLQGLLSTARTLLRKIYV